MSSRPVKRCTVEDWNPVWDSIPSLLAVLKTYQRWAESGASDVEITENINRNYGGRKAEFWVRRAVDEVAR